MAALYAAAAATTTGGDGDETFDGDAYSASLIPADFVAAVVATMAAVSVAVAEC